ncbi:MAG: STY4851/ECs_5259 family protein [Rubrivivax sp.]
MERFHAWFQSFLERRELTRPDGRMLFSYRTTRGEYLELRALLADMLLALDGAPWTLRSRVECACFVLYAAEWWRREYEGDSWRWTNILASIGPAYRLEVVERTSAVEVGLGAWGHRPSGQGKKYLGAIVAQGGLPLRLVARGGGVFGRLLTRAMRQAQLYGWDGQRLESFFHAYDHELVQHLRDEEIYRLLSSVVTTVLGLRRDHKLAGVSNPVDVLERLQPDWRNFFPIVVEEDQSAEALLVGLVREAAREITRGAVYPVTATRTLQPAGDGSRYQLVTVIQMPASVPLEALKSAIGVEADKIPQAFSLDLVGTQRLPLADARQLLGSSEPTVLLSGKSHVLRGENSFRELRFAVRSKGMELQTPVSFPGGDELDEAQPWIFVERDGAWVLAGVGGCRVAEDKCLVAVPQAEKLRPLDPNSTVVHWGELATMSMPRALYKVSGSVEAVVDSVVFLVRTHQTAGLSEQLLWRGQREVYPSTPFPVYRGVPRLYRLGDEGAPIPVHERQVVWMTAMRDPVRVENPRLHAGPIDAWLTADGSRIRRFRMVLLPEQAVLRFKSGNDDRSGAVEFQRWGIASVDVPPAAGSSVAFGDGVVRVNLSASGRPPAFLEFRLTWEGNPHALRLTLPFPATGARFTTSNGEELTHGHSISAARMAGVRVQVLDRNPNQPQKYKLVAELESGSASHGGHRPRFELPIAISADGSGELRLLDIEASLLGLLCQSDLLDARLLLRVLAGANKLAELSVTRYDVDLERQEAQAVLTASHYRTLSTEQLQGLKLCAVPMLQVDFLQQELVQVRSEEVPTGRWDLSALSASDSPWLVVSTDDSSLVVRPLLHRVPDAVAPTFTMCGLCPLAQAMSIDDLTERSRALETVVGVMAADYDHPSWRLVVHQYTALSHLPLSTLDYWRACARSPASGLAILLKLSHDMPRLALRMREELGVVWELIPAAAVSEALERLHRSWSVQLGVGQDVTVRVLTEQIFRQLAASAPVLSDVVELTLFTAGFGRTRRVDELFGEVRSGTGSLAQHLWSGQDSLLQRFLLRTHLDDEFWPGFELTYSLINKLRESHDRSFHQLLSACGRDLRRLFWLPTLSQHGPYAKNVKQDVANVPVLCGLLSQLASEPQAWWTQDEILKLRQLRAFAPAWFEVACRLGGLLALSIQEQSLARAVTTATIARQDSSGARTWRTSVPLRN